MEKKEITSGEVIKAIKTGFISYGILIFFLCGFLFFMISNMLHNFPNANQEILSISLPLLTVFSTYFIFHMLCRVSTFDAFRKCKTNPNNIEKISKKMNAFYIGVTIFLIILSICFISLQLCLEKQAIRLDFLRYSELFSEDFAYQLTYNSISEFNNIQTRLIKFAIIFYFGLILSCISLIKFQRKILKQYNT